MNVIFYERLRPSKTCNCTNRPSDFDGLINFRFLFQFAWRVFKNLTILTVQFPMQNLHFCSSSVRRVSYGIALFDGSHDVFHSWIFPLGLLGRLTEIK